MAEFSDRLRLNGPGSHVTFASFFPASPGQATTGASTFGSSSGSLFGAASSNNAAATSTSSSTGLCRTWLFSKVCRESFLSVE